MDLDDYYSNTFIWAFRAIAMQPSRALCFSGNPNYLVLIAILDIWRDSENARISTIKYNRIS